MRSSQLLAALLLAFSTLSVASQHADPLKRELLPRQTRDSSPSETGRNAESTGTSDEEEPVETSKPKSTKSSSSDNEDDSSNDSSSKDSEDSDKKGSDKKGSSTTRKKSKTTRIPEDAQAGRISMVTPDPYSGYQIYKIGDTITFAWNYTDVVASPTAINVAAFCSLAGETYTITGNASAGMTKVLWDTGKYQSSATNKLPVATYTLNIWDSGHSMKDVAEPGYLQAFQNFQFGMYTPQDYKPLNEFECATCDPNAASTMDKYTIRMVLGMGLLAATSFTWFVTHGIWL